MLFMFMLFHLLHFQAEFVNQVLHFETKRKTNEELNAQVLLICVT